MYSKKLAYINYTSYKTIELSSLPVNEDNIRIIYWEDVIGNKWFVEGEGDCVLYIDGVTKRKGNRRQFNSFVFKNKGNVIIRGAGHAKLRSLIFDNDGDVNVEYITRPTKSGKSVRNSKNIKSRMFSFPATKFLVRNRGDFVVYDPDKFNVVFMSECVLDCQNTGIVHIKVESLNDSVIKNENVCHITCKHGVRNCVFENGCDLYIQCSKFINSNAGNRGEFTLRCDSIGGETDTIYNNGNFIIKGNVPFISCWRMEISNKKDFILQCPEHSVMTSIGKESKKNIVFTNAKNVNLNNIDEIAINRMSFDNGGNVYAENIKKADGKYIFRNNGNVLLNNLKTMDLKTCGRNNEVSIMNRGMADLSSYDICDDKCIPLIMCTGKCIVRSNKCIGTYDKAKNPLSPVCYKKDNIEEYPNTSYLKRYGIQIENGYAILYKGVKMKAYTAPYDNDDTVWNHLGVYEHKNWNPYDNEVGKGKYVASYSPDVFYMYLNTKEFTVLKIKVALSDLYEWPSFVAKYPYFIGFRCCEVIEIYGSLQ